MPKGNKPKREGKKPKKKKDDTKGIEPPTVFTSAQVEVVRKRKKPREEQ